MACHLFSHRERILSAKLRIALAIGLCAMAFPCMASDEGDSVASQDSQQTPRILILDPVVRGGDPKEGREFAGWLTTALGNDGRAIAYRPTAATRSEASLAVSCGDSSCAKEWRQKMSLEQIWFGSMEWEKDSFRVRISALDAKDSVIAQTKFVMSSSQAEREWKANVATATVEKILARLPAKRTIVLDMKTVREKPRVLVLDPEVPDGDPMEGREFAGWLTTALRQDERTIPYRPTPGRGSDSSLAASCGEVSCAKEWFKAMPLEQVWFGSMEKDADSVRLRIQALDAHDSVIARSEHKEAKFIADRRWQIEVSEAAVENLLSNVPAKRTILLDGSIDGVPISDALAQQIAQKEKQYRSRLKTGGIITGIGAGTVVFGFAVLVATTVPCGLHLHFPSMDGGTEGMSPEDRRRHDQAKAEEAAREQAEEKSCEERSPGKPIMMLGGAALIGGLATLISASELSVELRDLRVKARRSKISIAPYISPSTQANGLLVSVAF